MFLGVVPSDCLASITSTVDFSSWKGVHVCCSGTFRFESALRQRFPDIPILSNDVSAFSGALAAVAADHDFDCTFKLRLDFMNDAVKGKDWIYKSAAILVAMDLARYKSKTEHSLTHFNNIKDDIDLHLEKTVNRLKERYRPLNINGYFAGDFLEHVESAKEKGYGVVMFPPFFKGGYETMFKFVHENIDWNAPNYKLYDPSGLQGIVDDLEDSSIPWVVLSDQMLDQEYFLKWMKGRRLPHYCYGTHKKQALIINLDHKTEPFKYKQIDFSKITPNSKITLQSADTAKINFIKDKYLAKSINYGTGLVERLVFIDDMLIGVISYNMNKFSARDCAYMLTDMAISKEGKLSKLVAYVSTCREAIRLIDLKLFYHHTAVVTTAFTKRHCSMKYRGVFKKTSSRPDPHKEGSNIIQYQSDIREISLDDCYKWWFDRYGQEMQKNAQNQN